MAGAPSNLPPVGSLSDYVSLANNPAGQAIDVALNLNPWLQVIMFALDILELAGIIPDPISLLLSLFSGRPREQASLLQAQRLMSAKNPAARQAGIMLERMVSEWDIVTSEGGPGRTILDAWAHLFVQNLMNQGVAQARAQQILTNATSEAAQAGLPLEPELQNPLTQNLTFNAPPNVSNDFVTQYQKAIAAGQDINTALKTAEQWLWKNEGLANLFKVWIGQWIPQNPPAQTVVPGQNGTCPQGYTLDPTTEMCTLPPTTPPSGPAPIGPGGGSGQPDPLGDEITNDLCTQMQAAAGSIVSAIQNLTPSTPTAPDPTCCQNVVDAIANVATALASIAANLAGVAGAPVDLSGVVAALNNLTNAVAAIPAPAPVDLSGVVNALQAINTTLSSGGQVNLQPIVDQLKNLVAEQDVSQTVINYLVEKNYIAPQDAQVFQGMPFGDWRAAWDGVGWHSILRGLVLGWLGYDIDTKTNLNPSAARVVKWLADAMGSGLKSSDSVIYPVLKPLVDLIKQQVSPAGTPPVGSAGVDLDQPVATALSVTLTAAITGYALSFLGMDAGEPLAHIAEVIGAAISFEELRDVQIGPLIREGVSRVAEMNAAALFQQRIPGAGEVYGWLARGLIDAARADQLAALNGLHFSLRAPTLQAMQQGLNPRMMLSAMDSGLLSEGDLQDELTFAGYRPASRQRLLTIAPWRATSSERNQLKATLETAYVQGLLADADLAQQIDQLDQNTDRDSLIMARVQLQKRIAFAKELENAYKQEFLAGGLTVDVYRANLVGLGLQDDWINARLALDEAHMNATLLRQQAAAQRALVRATAAEERRAAMKNFTTGNTDAAALAAQLVATGLTVTQAAAWVDLAVLQKAGGLRWTYGLQLPPSQAALLRARVSALSDQRKRLLITEAQFLTALAALGIPQPYVNSINAAASAMITPKTSAVAITVETS